MRPGILYLQYIRLPRLTHLALRRNGIEDLTPLQGLITLTHLDLRDNEIKDLFPLHGLTGLTYLALSKNKIEDLTHLQELTGLNDLDIANNPIEDLHTLTGLAERRFNEREGGLWRDGSGNIVGRPILVHHNVPDTEEPTWCSVLSPGPGETLDVNHDELSALLARNRLSPRLSVEDGVPLW